MIANARVLSVVIMSYQPINNVNICDYVLVANSEALSVDFDVLFFETGIQNISELLYNYEISGFTTGEILDCVSRC